ncbi:synaptotagmin-15 [Lepisosteus oculatus]|uniref:synaptotagmin-15 n=1 Tax=Lepisosteus oculatus TaxID=7918 RepID=UPI00371468B4
MAVPLSVVSAGLVAGILLSLLLGIAIYFLWKRKCLQGRYEELVSSTPSVQSNQPATSLSSNQNSTSGIIPFVIPPHFITRRHLEKEEEESSSSDPCHHHRRSFYTRGSLPLGSLRANLYRFPAETCDWETPQDKATGLWFSVEYRPETEQLLVSLLRATNLPSLCQVFPTLVKVHLLPAERHHVQAKAKRKSCNPQFGDSFVFQVSSRSLPQHTLCFSLCVVDKQKKHQPLGLVRFHLYERDLSEAAGRVLWRHLEKDSTESCSGLGDIQVSLNYNQSLQRLTVVVLRARALQLHYDREPTGVFVQVSLQIHTELVKSKSTAVVKADPSPTFNETLTFNLPSSQLDAACLRLELRQLLPDQHQSLGLVVIGPFMYARGQEQEHWNDMVSKPQKLIKQWHTLHSMAGTQSPS